MKRTCSTLLSVVLVLNLCFTSAFAENGTVISTLYEDNECSSVVSNENATFNDCRVSSNENGIILKSTGKNNPFITYTFPKIKRVMVKFKTPYSCSAICEDGRIVISSNNPLIQNLMKDMVIFKDKTNTYAKSEHGKNYKVDKVKIGMFDFVNAFIEMKEPIPNDVIYYGMNVLENSDLGTKAKLIKSDVKFSTVNYMAMYEYTNTYEFETPVNSARIYFDISSTEKMSNATILGIKIDGIKPFVNPDDPNKPIEPTDPVIPPKPIEPIEPIDPVIPPKPSKPSKRSHSTVSPNPVALDKVIEQPSSATSSEPNVATTQEPATQNKPIPLPNNKSNSGNNNEEMIMKAKTLITNIFDKLKQGLKCSIKPTKNLVIKNEKTITLKEINEAKINNTNILADTSHKGKVKSRVYIGRKDDVSSNINVKFNNKASKNTNRIFQKFFSNNVECVKFGENGNSGVKLNVAVKLDLSKLDTGNLHFYAYNNLTNTYYKMKKPKYHIDEKDYLYFSMPMDKAVVITDKPLSKNEK